jgi:uncharacterized protein YkwD
MTAVALTLVVPVAAGAAGNSAPPSGSAAATATAPSIESALLSAMNDARTDRGRRPLKAIATLQRPARGQSRYLVVLGVLDHDGRDGSPFYTRLFAAGFPRGHSLAENLAMVPGCSLDVARQTVKVWLASPAHRTNLLNPAYRWAGVGIASDAGCSSTVATADFGS